MAGADQSPGNDGVKDVQSELIDLSHAIDRSTWSPFQMRVFCLVGLAIILDGFDNQVLGFALPALLVEWELEKSAVAPVLSISLIGMTCGAAIAGTLGDRLGRKNILIFCVALFGEEWLVRNSMNWLSILMIFHERQVEKSEKMSCANRRKRQI